MNEPLIPFIETLPAITAHFINAGEGPSLLLFMLLLKMRQVGNANNSFISQSPWVEKYISKDDDSFDEDKRQALMDVLHQLLDVNDWENQYSGLICYRLRTIIQLYFFFGGQEFHAPVQTAMYNLYPKLTIATLSYSEDDTAVDQAFLDDSRRYFLELFQDSPSTFESFCMLFISEMVFSLPYAVRRCINLHLGGPWMQEGDSELSKSTAAGLENFFTYFSIRGDDLTIPRKEAGSYHTLLWLVGTVGFFCLGKHGSDPYWWQLFYSWFDRTEERLTKFSTSDPIPTSGCDIDEEDRNSPTDDISNHSHHTETPEDRRVIHADHLHQLIDKMKGALDKHPLPYPSGSSSHAPQLNEKGKGKERQRQ
jgi:hypothetical protein